jgi:hypothetical protein
LFSHERSWPEVRDGENAAAFAALRYDNYAVPAAVMEALAQVARKTDAVANDSRLYATRSKMQVMPWPPPIHRLTKP